MLHAFGKSISARLGGAFALMLLAFVATAWMGLAGMERNQAVLRDVMERRMARARTGQDAMAMVNTNLRSRLSLFMARDSMQIVALFAEQTAQSGRISDFYKRIDAQLAADTSAVEERRLFAEVKARRSTYLGRFNDVKKMLLAGQRAPAGALFNEDVLPRAIDYLRHWETFVAFQQQQVDAAAAESEIRYRRVRRITLLVMAGSALLAAFVAFWALRRITVPLTKMQHAARAIARGELSQEIDVRSDDELGELANAFRGMTTRLRMVLGRIESGASEVSSTATELAASAEEMAASAEQVASVAESLADGAAEQTRSVSSVSSAAGEAARHADEVEHEARMAERAGDAMAAAADSGAESAAHALQSMAAISAAMSEALPLVEVLAGKADAVGAIARTVEQIAGQTRLLALNAAIEAARAGTEGRGFAVVADETRKLAEATSRAVTGVQQLVDEMRQAAGLATARVGTVNDSVIGGARVIRESAASLGDISIQVAESRATLSRIAMLAAEQRSQVASLADAVAQIAGTADANVAASEEVRSVAAEQTASMIHVTEATQRLAEIARGLHGLTSQFAVGTEESGGTNPAIVEPDDAVTS
jgi:methyl-accepting chemotaxis protein